MADHAHSSHSSEQEHTPHVLPGIVYWKVYGALMLLLFLTVWVAYQHIPVVIISVGIALTIAIVKMVLVILYFMHVRFQSRLTWLWASIGFVWLVILLTVVTDYMARPYDPRPVGWTAGAAEGQPSTQALH